jgi:hypothetical protein
MVTAVKRPLGSGEPLVTAVWKTLSIVVLICTAVVPVVAITAHRHLGDMLLIVLALYATAFAASCLYNKIRYGQMFAPKPTIGLDASTPIDTDQPPNGRRMRGPSRLHHRRTRRLLDDVEYELGRPPPSSPRRKRARV